MAVECRCEPVPWHLRDVFPGCKIVYEDPQFNRTRCEWHWEVPCRVAKARMCISGPSSIWVTMATRGLKVLKWRGIAFSLRQDEGRRVVVQVSMQDAVKLGKALRYARQ